MDLNLVTGKPGASKTLNTIKDVEKRRIEEARPVYYHGIKDLILPWIKMDDSEKLEEDETLITPHSWWNAPFGSIIVIDEAQLHYPAMSINAQQPEYIKKFGQFRHLGYSMYLITQGPLLINPSFKGWVQPHIHYKRLWGGWYVRKFVNEDMITEVRSSKMSETAIKSIIKIDKSVFGWYKSAELHTTNKRVNGKMWLMLLLPLIIVPLCFWFSFKTFTSQLDSGETVEPDKLDASATVAPAPGQDQSINGFGLMPQGQTAFNPLTDYLPRIEAMPETAPAYDELRKPVDFPRPQCMYQPQNDTCQCYTQQATLMRDYPRDLCLAYVREGYFDATKPRVEHRFDVRETINTPGDLSLSLPNGNG